ncbi:MAG: T9SS type A sorting domain-containing protein [Bacteroidota bacterium]|nr:T9SS type A sorting domain-containing protein [Bacteroidota bacterium]
MVRFYKYLISSLLLLAPLFLTAQETLLPLEINPVIKNNIKQKNDPPRTKYSKGILELPFIDDFSKPTIFPDSSLWINNYAFVNTTYAINPITIGAVSLDAINYDGSLYPDAGNLQFAADTLTSQQINLDYPGNNSIFLSFYYQPGGLGDTPEPKDTLLVEFYAPEDQTWHKAWHATFNAKDSMLIEYYTYNNNEKIHYGDTLNDLKKEFFQVIIPVQEEHFLKESFQFRFRNYASFSTNSDLESKTSNSDHWHLDFILLDKDRNINDTIINDIAFIKPMESLLKNYESIPWTHFTRASAYEMEDSISITYRNIGDQVWNISREFEIEDIMGFTGTEEFTGGTGANIEPFTTEKYKRVIDYIFPYTPENDSALFEIRSYMVTDTLAARESYRWNDTTLFHQKFFNYYAFDDGSAENGYGLYGEGSELAMVAMRFNTYKKDTLRGIQIYFNQSINQANQNYFTLMIWEEDNNRPGSIIYRQEDVKPVDQDSLNKFTHFILDTPLILETPFYIGWQKISTPEMLNVGFDANRINNNKIFYNLSGGWKQSQFEGTLMIRPMFGHELNVETSTKETYNSTPLNFTIYPNPAKDKLHLKVPGPYSNYRYTIFDSYGRIYIDNWYDENAINISQLNPGFYFIRVSSEQKYATKKFIVIH